MKSGQSGLSCGGIPDALIPSRSVANGGAVVEAYLAGRKPDPELVRRVRERAAKITEEIRRKHGVLDIGVPAIREFRDRE